ncbi:hypothetical protein DL765_001439 [Monosporascus sp. GIB2]|nr:hypothetical protein DL765_001439 [Monosporascus sp. GIB2]
MSFGFSIGDFITVLNLANKIRKEFVSAPSQFKNICDEVRSLSIIVQDVDIALSACEPNHQQKADLRQIASSCHNILVDLEKTLDKYGEMEHNRGNLGERVTRVWKKLKWEPEDIRDLRNRITSNSSQTAFATRKGINRLNKRLDDQERLTVLDWLTPIDYAPEQSGFIKLRQAGTGQWLLDSPEFQTWLQGDKQALFCPGIPGAGKTILTSIVIDELITRFGNDENFGIAYVYCNFRRKHEQKAEDLLASLLKQLAQGRSSLLECVKSLYAKHKQNRSRPSFNEISETLQSTIMMYSKVFIIVDALDECQSPDGCRSRFLAEIFYLNAECGANFFATSRFVSEIMGKFDRSTSLEIRASAEDVRRYVDGRMSHLPSFVGRSPDLKEEVKAGIVRAADGIDTMERIKGQVVDQEELAMQVLSWITCARRPLTIPELQHALAVEVGEPQLDEENLPQIEDMISVCAGLATVDEESKIIRLVHYTTQEYFERTQKDWFPHAEANITTICITYLSFTDFESGLCGTDSEFEQRLRANPLYDYAAHNWGHHARETLTLPQVVMDFLGCEAKVQASSQALMASKWSRDSSNYSQWVPRQITGLHLAAYFGIQEAVKALLGAYSPYTRDSDYKMPMSWAAKNEHEAVVNLLFTEMVIIKATDKHGRRLPILKRDGYDLCKKVRECHMMEGHQPYYELFTPTLGRLQVDPRTWFYFKWEG